MKFEKHKSLFCKFQIHVGVEPELEFNVHVNPPTLSRKLFLLSSV